MTTDVRRDLQAFVARYQRALLAQGGLMTAVGGALLGVLGWRLAHTRLPVLWSTMLLIVAGLAGVAALSIWWKRHWLSRAKTMRQLDDALGLEQRLITLAQFETAKSPPLLYPLLVQDTQRKCSMGQPRMPRLMDRTSGILAIALLILLLWPGGSRLPMPFAPRPSPTPPEPSPRHEAPPEPERSDDAPSSDQSKPSSPKQKPGDGMKGQQPQPPDPTSDGDEGTGQQPQASGDGASGQPTPQPQGSSQGDRQAGQQAQQAPGDRGSDQGTQAQRDAATAGRQQQDAASQQGQDGQRTAEQASGRQEQQSQGAQSARGQQPSSEGAPGGRDDRAFTSGQQDGQGGNAFGKQEALRGDIKELLEELRGELQNLQAQLEAQKDEFSSSQPGTGTDAELYEGPTGLEAGTIGRRSLQLTTDQEPTSSKRPGGGVGDPSDQVSAVAPQMRPESAELATQPREELAGQRMVVPPEYRQVFETLRRRDQPSAPAGAGDAE